MPGKGPAPKPADQRRRRNAPRPSPAVVDDSAGPFGPELAGDGWHPETLRWWQTWRESPQAAAFLPTDWDFLRETAVLHTAFWSDPSKAGKVAAELRLRVAKYGATVEDRARLQMVATKVPDRPKPVAASQVSDLAARRRRLTGA